MSEPDNAPRRVSNGRGFETLNFVRLDMTPATVEEAPGDRLPFSALAATSGFRQDARFLRLGDAGEEPVPKPAAEDPGESADETFARIYTEGFDAGFAEASRQAEAMRLADADAREGLALSVARLDAELEETLRLRLRDTVVALCETAIAPLALDRDLLLRRIEKAVGMLSRADDERVIRLNPEDLEFLSPRFAAEWKVVPDPTLERGALRVESEAGGVADGPDVWRRTIAEALQQC